MMILPHSSYFPNNFWPKTGVIKIIEYFHAIFRKFFEYLKRFLHNLHFCIVLEILIAHKIIYHASPWVLWPELYLFQAFCWCCFLCDICAFEEQNVRTYRHSQWMNDDDFISKEMLFRMETFYTDCRFSRIRGRQIVLI